MYSQQYRGQAGDGSQATYDAALGTLSHLNSEELQKLMDDNVRFDELVKDLIAVKNVEADKETLITMNKSIAENNLSMEPRLNAMRQQLAETYEQAIQVQKSHERNQLKIDGCTSAMSPDVMLALLQTEAAKSDEESEKVAESFLARQVDTDDFLARYVTLRTQTHTRKVKAEKMAEIIRDPNRQNFPTTGASQPVFPNGPAPAIPSRQAPQPPYMNYAPPPVAAPNRWSAPYPPANPVPYQMPPNASMAYLAR